MKRSTWSILFTGTAIGVVAWSCPGCIGSIPSPAARHTPSTPVAKVKDRDKDSRQETNSASPGSMVTTMRVNDEKVEASELWWNLHDELADNARTLEPGQYRQYLLQRSAQLITDKIAEVLLYQRASLRVSEELADRVDKLVDAEVRKIIATQYDGVERRYVRDLESKGQKLDEVKARIRREIIIASYLEQEVRPKVTEPTRPELMALFEENAESFRRPGRREMSLIDVRIMDRLPSGASEPSREQWQTARSEGRSLIQTAQSELESGVPFADVARRYSDGLHAADGGVWGTISKGSVRERFVPAVEALYGLGAGQVSDIIETEDGFFLVRCDRLDPGFEPTFEAVQPELKQRYARDVYNQLIAELVTDMRAKARIEPADLALFHAGVVEAAGQINSGE